MNIKERDIIEKSRAPEWVDGEIEIDLIDKTIFFYAKEKGQFYFLHLSREVFALLGIPQSIYKDEWDNESDDTTASGWTGKKTG